MKQDLSPQALMCLAVADEIKEHPETFNMATWGICGTTHCVAGKAILRAGGPRQLRELIRQTILFTSEDNPRPRRVNPSPRSEWPIVRRAAELLGVPLNEEVVSIVFFDLRRNADDTVKILRHLAATGEVLGE